MLKNWLVALLRAALRKLGASKSCNPVTVHFDYILTDIEARRPGLNIEALMRERMRRAIIEHAVPMLLSQAHLKCSEVHRGGSPYEVSVKLEGRTTFLLPTKDTTCDT